MKMPNKTLISFLTVLLLCILPVHAQDKMESLVTRQKAFGAKLPQEQVFIHMDNTCYHLGDTIYYKAYVRREDNSRPTNLSGILYCELLNNDGYLVERQMIPLENGEGHGSFSLTDTLQYAGYYELRAYTKWQLNWGVTERKHASWIEQYFFNKDMLQDYFRDYEKLYSRVFPVFDRPLSPGENYRDMSLRPLATYYKTNSEAPKTTIQFFPEGGTLVADTHQRVAWEARNELGQSLDGTLTIIMPDGSKVTSVTQNRGRGVFSLLAPSGKSITATFTPSGGEQSDNPSNAQAAQAKLPKAETDGVALQVNCDISGLTVSYQAAGNAEQEALGLTIMKGGVLKHFCKLDREEVKFPAEEPGVYQVTVFNADGRVYADRLSFFLPAGFKAENVQISGVNENVYKPFSPISLELHGEPNASMSVSVRDAAGSEYIYDTGTMLTETLLSSQIRGFVPHPEWFFLEDTPERRTALDLLLMVQGWHKYSWHDMAVAGNFELRHMPEGRFPMWTGQINNYTATQVLDIAEENARKFAAGQQEMTAAEAEEEKEKERETAGQKASERFNKQEDKLKHPMALHAEFAQPGQEGVTGDMKSDGNFSLQIPRYWGEYFFFLAASDTTKWKDGKAPVWTQNGRTTQDKMDFPEFYVKLNPAFPRFPKQYDYYQSHLAPIPDNNPLKTSPFDDVRILNEVLIKNRHGGRRKFSYWKPAMIVDAYEAFNATCDAGLAPGHFMGSERFRTDVAVAYFGDMQSERTYDIGMRFDGKIYIERTAEQKRKQDTSGGQAAKAADFIPMPDDTSNISENKLSMYDYLWNLSDVVLYTDYSPRNAELMQRDANPTVTVDLKLLEGGEQRSYQRNRRWKMKGFSVPDEFYSPDYSNSPLPAADYRRTLYWNPSVKLDETGRASITLYNNSTPTYLQVRAEGWTVNGTPQCGNVH